MNPSLSLSANSTISLISASLYLSPTRSLIVLKSSAEINPFFYVSNWSNRSLRTCSSVISLKSINQFISIPSEAEYLQEFLKFNRAIGVLIQILNQIEDFFCAFIHIKSDNSIFQFLGAKNQKSNKYVIAPLLSQSKMSKHSLILSTSSAVRPGFTYLDASNPGISY